MATAEEFLLRAQNPDGGWGYRVRGMSFVEPTACVLLALSSPVFPSNSYIDQSRNRAIDFLVSLQHPDGGWGVGTIDSQSGWMTAWAVYALARSGTSENVIARGVRWLLSSQAMRVTGDQDRRQAQELFHIDSTLVGFAWQPGDAAWVHPTALALLALVAAGKSGEGKSSQAVAFLLDRAIETGGWNIGNPQMVGQPMPATVQDSAVTLLALKAAGERTDPRIATGLDFLTQAVHSTEGVSDLAWGAYALGEWQLPSSEALTRLAEKQNADGSWVGNPFTTAVVILSRATRERGN